VFLLENTGGIVRRVTRKGRKERRGRRGRGRQSGRRGREEQRRDDNTTTRHDARRLRPGHKERPFRGRCFSLPRSPLLSSVTASHSPSVCLSSLSLCCSSRLGGSVPIAIVSRCPPGESYPPRNESHAELHRHFSLRFMHCHLYLVSNKH